MRSAENIKNRIIKTRIKTNPQVNKAVLDNLFNRMDKADSVITNAKQPNIWRTIMNSKTKKIALAAVIIIAALITINQFGGAIDGSNVAFAKVLQNIQHRGYTFSQWIETNGETSLISKATVIDTGLIRWEMEGETPFGAGAMIFDVSNEQITWISKKGTVIGKVGIPSDSNTEIWMKPISNLWDLKDGTEEFLGEKEIKGNIVTGFKVARQIEAGTINFIVWADVNTNLPVEVEIVPLPQDADAVDDFKIVLKDFDYDVEIDPSLFGIAEKPQDQAQDSDKLVIRVGQGVGDLDFGMTVQQMKDILGQPDLTLGKSVFQYQGFALTAPRDQKVTGIMCGDPDPTDSTILPDCNCITVEGIGIGSSQEEIIAAYGEPSLKRSGSIEGSTELIYRTKRMKFMLFDSKLSHMYFGPQK